MSKPYQWSVGELCIYDPIPGAIDNHEISIGTVTWVKEIDPDPYPSFIPPMEGISIRVSGEPYIQDEWSDGADFRPLHGTDIRKLEEKYPEYVIKTNEVEG